MHYNIRLNAKGGSKTPVDLNAFGNKTSPRGARPKQDFGVDSFDDIVGGKIADLPNGASTVADVNKVPLSGHYHTLPKGTKLPNGLGIISDGSDVISGSLHSPGHYTIYPTRETTVNGFNDLFKSLPWSYGGKK